MALQQLNKVLILFALTDTVLLLLSVFLAKEFSCQESLPETQLYIVLLVSWISLWILISIKFDLYEQPSILEQQRILAKNLQALFLFAVMTGALVFFLADRRFLSLFFMDVLFLFSFGILIWRISAIYFLKRWRRKGGKEFKVVLVGVDDNVYRLIDRVYSSPNHGFQIEGVFTNVVQLGKSEIKRKGKLSEAISFLENKEIDEIIISLPYTKSSLINQLIRYADNHMIRVRVIPEFSGYLFQTFTIDYIENIPLMKLREKPLQCFINRVLKRTFDVIFSLAVVIFIFSWLFPVISLAIKLTSKGPVFFRQQRTGRNGSAFTCWKFRSMVVNGQSDSLQATKNDPRFTKVGAFLRRTSLDELPQFFNVLNNKMSIIGPRPHMLKHTEEYSKLVDKFMVRHFAKPGITGWAQITGYRGETKTVQDMENRANADIWYIENWSFLLDCKILFKTIFTVFFTKEENAF
jgi:undecaprenyl-phosphate galactose phosphotransferase/putative colanic acid biosynthesis UDP-glucose lipid carrier transferase